MKLPPFMRRWRWVELLALLVFALALVGLRTYLHSPSRGLPYRDSFANAKADEWKAFGGTWELVNGLMHNGSDERGAKLLTGSTYWRNYYVEADVNLLGTNGDAGLIIRSRDEEEGVNAYTGYYAGVRTIDSTLVLGRDEHGWMEVNKQAQDPEGIRAGKWYHLKLLAYDCHIVATAAALPQSATTLLAISDPDCIPSGRVGLRSYSSGGIWRNVVVRPATHEDLVAMLKSADGSIESEPRIPGQYDAETFHRFPEPEETRASSTARAQSIESLRFTSFSKPATATVRGVVTLTAPRLFVQDSTGGVYLPQPKAPLLKVGDEVEVTGEVHPGDFSSTMEHATVQLLWARTPMPPVSVTAFQASTGKFDAAFIEVQGRLAAKMHGTDNTLVLDLDEGPQSFRAILNPGRSDYLFNNLKLNSSLRLRGICVVDPAFTRNLTPFVLLLRSNEDLEVLAGPPWWSTLHVISIVVALLLVALAAIYLYHRVEHWRLQGVLEERQRLAHEMHDTLAQSFAGIGFQLQAIRNGLPDGNSPLLQQLDLARNLVRHSHEEARRSIATLRPESLESEDILCALDHCAKRMVEGGCVQVVSGREGDQIRIPLRIADTLYRIGQEAVANAIRHANPTLLTIQFKYAKDLACLLIEDNGVGFAQGNGLMGFGIRGMKRRAQTISAEFQIESKPGEGTRITITAPLPPRVTFTTLPKLFSRYVREHWTDARPSKHADSHSYSR